MSDAIFQCPCCGQETAAICSIEEVAARFSGVSRDLIDALSKGRWMSRGALFTILYGHRADAGPESPQIIASHICQLREKLSPFGYTIEARAGGWSGRGGLYRIAPLTHAVAS